MTGTFRIDREAAATDYYTGQIWTPETERSTGVSVAKKILEKIETDAPIYPFAIAADVDLTSKPPRVKVAGGLYNTHFLETLGVEVVDGGVEEFCMAWYKTYPRRDIFFSGVTNDPEKTLRIVGEDTKLPIVPVFPSMIFKIGDISS